MIELLNITYAAGYKFNFGMYYSAITQGMVLSILALGVYITYKILDYADLTVDGSFVTGTSICAAMIVGGTNPFVTLGFAFIYGLAMGFVTAFLHTKLRIPALLAGIITQFGLYSVNLRIMGKSNVQLLRSETIYTMVSQSLKISNTNAVFLVSIIIIVIVVALMCWFFKTQFGLALRATGSNQRMIRALGVNTNVTITIALMLSNGLVALSGSMYAMQQGYSDINMGIGMIITGLAAVIVGEVFFGKRTIFQSLSATVMGAIVFELFRPIAIDLGLPPTDMKLVKAIVLAAALSLPTTKQKLMNVFKKSTEKPE